MAFLSFPKRITLELTNRCNISCTFCLRHTMGDVVGVMEKELAFHLIDDMAKHLPITFVPFFRGESLLHPQWSEIINYAKTKGLGPIQFTTNATLLNDKNARRLLSCGVDFMSFSLDTLDPILYEQSRLGANFHETHKNILHFLELHKKAGNPFPVQVSAVETQEHKIGMNEFVAYWQPRVDRVRVYVQHSSDGNPGSTQELFDDTAMRMPCKKVQEDMIILWNGDVAICNHDWQRQKNKSVFANVATSGIQEAWNSAGYTALREAHAKGELKNFPPCDKCEQWRAFYMPENLLGRLYTR